MRNSISIVAAAAATTAATVMIGTPAVVALEGQVSRYTPSAADMCIVNRKQREREKREREKRERVNFWSQSSLVVRRKRERERYSIEILLMSHLLVS